MNRIDKIKITVEGVVPWHTNWTDSDVEDVKYLLSKLEIAEKALNDVLTEFGYNHIEPSERLQEIEHIAEDGIKQIRE